MAVVRVVVAVQLAVVRVVVVRVAVAFVGVSGLQAEQYPVAVQLLDAARCRRHMPRCRTRLRSEIDPAGVRRGQT